MSKLTLRLITGVLTFTFGVIAATGWYLWHLPPALNNAPIGWQKVDVDRLYLLLPADMKQQEIKGIDTFDFQYSDNDMTVDIEYGINQGDFSELAKYPDYHGESLVIDGRSAKLCVCRTSKSTTDYGDAEHPYITAIYFREPWSDSYSLNMWAKSKDITGQEVAKRIFLTTKFK